MSDRSLFDPQPAARATDPQESHDAAESAKPTADNIRNRVLNALIWVGPMTDEQIVEWFELQGWAGSPSGIRTRRSELFAANRIRRYSEDGRTRSGRRCARWTY